MRQLSQERKLHQQFQEAEETTRQAVNRLLWREFRVRGYASPEAWQIIVRQFKAKGRPTHDLVEYERRLQEYAWDRLYYGALLHTVQRRAKSNRRAAGVPFVREKSRARNLDIAWFVVERVIPFRQLVDTEQLLVGPHGPGAGLPWDDLADEWNRTHPHDPFGSGKRRSRGDNLKDEYYRACRRLGIEPLGQFSSAAVEVLQEFMREDKDIPRRLFQTAAAQRDRLLAQQPLARKPLDTWTRTDEAEWRLWLQKEIQAYRDALTLQDLIRHHLCRVTMSDAPSGDKQQYHRAPLRPWFLTEVREARGEPVVDWDMFLLSADPLTEAFRMASWPGWT